MSDDLSSPISPAELVADVLQRLGRPDIAPMGVVVGPATNAQQQGGVVQMSQAGLPAVERYVPAQWMRCQIRCLAGTLEEADQIAQKVQQSLHGKQRVIARMASTDHRYLIHLLNITSGPSMHYDSAQTWEELLFAEIMIGTDPIS